MVLIKFKPHGVTIFPPIRIVSDYSKQIPQPGTRTLC